MNIVGYLATGAVAFGLGWYARVAQVEAERRREYAHVESLVGRDDRYFNGYRGGGDS